MDEKEGGKLGWNKSREKGGWSVQLEKVELQLCGEGRVKGLLWGE